MQETKTMSRIALALGLLACNASHAQDAAPAPQFSIGAKLWNASWMSYIPATYLGATAGNQSAVGDIIDSAEGSRETSILPQLAVRYGNYFVAASYGRFKSDFSLLSSPVITPAGTLITSRTDHFVRRESDLVLGYYVLPQLALTVGYKYAKESRDTRLGIAPQSVPFLVNKADAVLVGAALSVPIQGSLNFYGSAGYGVGDIKTRTVDNSIAQIDARTRYLIGEFGLSYPILVDSAGLRAVSAALGYRTQTVKTRSTGTVYGESRRLRDVRDGLVLSLNVSL